MRVLAIATVLALLAAGCVSSLPTGQEADEPLNATDTNATAPEASNNTSEDGSSVTRSTDAGNGTGDAEGSNTTDTTPSTNETPPAPKTARLTTGPRPHVVVGIPDSGINPYHEIYRRPALTEHPCTYLPDYPCDIPALELTLDVDSWKEGFEADKELWRSIEPGDWYWIPGTVFVAVHCQHPYNEGGAAAQATAGTQQDLCILDDTNDHGTGTTSSVLMENPDALIAFQEGSGDVEPFLDRGIPVDIYSVSWGTIVPLPLALIGDEITETPALFVKAAGNDPRPLLTDHASGHPNAIAVSGAYAEDTSEEPNAADQPDVVSYHCRPVAKTRALTGTAEACGTSFAAPTVAGGLSKVVLTLRRASGYTGTVSEGSVDPHQGITLADVRDAMNRTASYDPEPEYDNTRSTSVPLNPAAPWLQWGWGFYDGRVADATVEELLGGGETASKSEAARTFMHTHHDARRALYG